MLLPPNPRALLLDLDGVLIDSPPPIRASTNPFLVAMGGAPLGDEAIRPLISPPLDVFASLPVGTEDPARIKAFVGHSRNAYSPRCFEDTPHAEGLHAVLGALGQRHVLVVATSKPEAYAIPLLEHVGVARHLHAIVGAGPRQQSGCGGPRAAACAQPVAR